MTVDRTTIRLDPAIKKDAERRAIEENTSLQQVISSALKFYLTTQHKQQAKKIVFKTHNLGAPLDNLTRADIYDDPIC